MASRIVVIVLALAAAAFKASQGRWVEAGGLLALGGGLVVLRLAARRPAVKLLAYLCFAVTAAALGIMLWRQHIG